jgi:ABC-type multidrug transport system fused ATPase/permease subunit
MDEGARIVIAHRLSTIRNVDRIYVIEAGRVVQQGSFEALAREEGVFAQLIARQLGNSL